MADSSNRKQYIDRTTIFNNHRQAGSLDDYIEAAYFYAAKMGAEREVQGLESKISTSIGEIEKTLNGVIANLCALEKIYCKSNPYHKKKIIGSIYPEKFAFEDLKD